MLGRKPTRPHSAAGILTEPPVSVPIAAGTMPEATAAPAPPLLPPGIRSRSYRGFRTAPKAALLEVIPNDSSCWFNLANTNAPDLSKCFTTSAFCLGR